MKETVECLLKMLVIYPERLEVNKIIQDSLTILQIIADPADIGKIIGKQGRVIKAIRLIVNAATIREKNRTLVEIKERNNKEFSSPFRH